MKPRFTFAVLATCFSPVVAFLTFLNDFVPANRTGGAFPKLTGAVIASVDLTVGLAAKFVAVIALLALLKNRVAADRQLDASRGASHEPIALVPRLLDAVCAAGSSSIVALLFFLLYAVAASLENDAVSRTAPITLVPVLDFAIKAAGFVPIVAFFTCLF